jgi:predicted nucleic acid-binding protein
MTPVVIDASVLAAIAFQEPEGAVLKSRLDGATVFAPTLLKFELANVAWKKAKRRPADAPSLLQALSTALDARYGITWHEINHVDAVLIARATGLSSYDASYLWLAGWLGADLVTLDHRMASVNALLAEQDWVDRGPR